MKKIIIYLFFMLTVFPNFSHAMNFTNNIEFKSQPLVLNGSGIRKKMFFSIYECGLYLPQKTTNYEDVMKFEKKLIKLSFIYKKLSPDKIKEAFKDGIEANYKNKIDNAVTDKFLSFFNFDIVSGDKIDLYFDKSLISVYHNEKHIGSLDNSLLAKALIDIYIGEKPIDESLKNKLLGK